MAAIRTHLPGLRLLGLLAVGHAHTTKANAKPSSSIMLASTAE